METKEKSAAVVPGFPRDNISVWWWRNLNGNASISTNILPELAAHWLSCHSYPVEVEDNVWSCVEMSKQIKGYPLCFVHPGGVFLWEPASVRRKHQLLRHNKCISALEMGLPFRDFSEASVPGYEHRAFRSQAISAWHCLKIRNLCSMLSWAFKIPLIVGLWRSGSVTRSTNWRWVTIYWGYPRDSNNGRVTAVSQDFWGEVWGISWPPIIDLLIRQEESKCPPQLNDKRNISHWLSFLVLFLSLDHGCSGYPQAVMDVCSQGYCHLTNRMRRDIKHDNMSFWINFKISCFRTSCKVIIHFR